MQVRGEQSQRKPRKNSTHRHHTSGAMPQNMACLRIQPGRSDPSEDTGLQDPCKIILSDFSQKTQTPLRSQQSTISFLVCSPISFFLLARISSIVMFAEPIGFASSAYTHVQALPPMPQSGFVATFGTLSGTWASTVLHSTFYTFTRSRNQRRSSKHPLAAAAHVQ